MGYIDREGNCHEDDSFQDRFLKALYKSVCGRMLVKVLTIPAISKLGGFFLNSYISTFAIAPFVKSHSIDLNQYVDQKYISYNDFFMRKIKPESRPVYKDDDVLVSPADGRISVYPVSRNGVFEIKNSPYTLATLLRDKKLAAKYYGGRLILIRLCVNDYHRYIYPANGMKSSTRRINGVLHTVNPVAAEMFPIYKENSREYVMLRTKEFGDIIQMEVGALMVGKIVNDIKPGRVYKGDEKGHFEFGGSTIILLIQKDKIDLLDSFVTNSDNGYETLILQGEPIGYSRA